MPVVKPDTSYRIELPEDYLTRRHLSVSTDYWLGELNGDLILHPRLPDIRKIYIEATTRCNLKCRTCIRYTWDDPLQDMSGETFQNLLDSLKDLPNLERVVITGFGEPLIHPKIMDMLEALCRKQIKVTLGTNGLLINQKIAREMVRMGVDRVMVSIDGGKPETFASVRGIMLSKIVENIGRLNEAKTALHTLYPIIGIEFVALKSNVDELTDLAHLSAKLGVTRVVVSNVLPYAEEMRQEVLYGYEPLPPFKTTSWALNTDAWVMWATEELPRMHWGAERRCRFVQDHAVVVGWDGNISPCYALSHNYSYFAIDGRKKWVNRYLLGNVNQNPLADIWMSEEYVQFRSQVKIFHFPSCPDCDLRETCDLREKNKDCWGCNPSCADCLWAQDIIRCP